MRPLAADVSWSVCWSRVTTVSCAKTDEPIEMSFGLWTLVGPRNHIFVGARIPLWEGAIFGNFCHARFLHFRYVNYRFRLGRSEASS